MSAKDVDPAAASAAVVLPRGGAGSEGLHAGNGAASDEVPDQDHSPLFCSCGKPAVWLYMPATERKEVNYCDEHVPRGCSCNIDPETSIEDTDEQGRLLPCVEYDFVKAEGSQ